MEELQQIIIETSSQLHSMENWWQKVERPTIFRAPPLMQKVDPDSYEPKIISFGPYHYGKPHLEVTQKLKWSYLQKFLSRNRDIGLEQCFTALKNLEKQARSTYSEKFSMESNEFIKMLLLDGSCMVEIMLTIWPPVDREKEDPRLNDPIIVVYWMREQVIIDILMLENQLPFFVLEKLFDLIFPSGVFLSLAISAIHYFGIHLLFRSEKMLKNEYLIQLFQNDLPAKDHSHLLHLFHTLLIKLKEQDIMSTSNNSSSFTTISASIVSVNELPETARKISELLQYRSRLMEDTKEAIRLFMLRTFKRIFIEKSFVMTGNVIPRATALRSAGIKFRAKKDSFSFLTVTFEKGKLNISQLPFWKKTNYFLRNLIAFEQCCPKVGTDIATYAAFMGCLITTAEDIAVLRKEDIILKLGSRDERAAFSINRLSDGVFVHSTQDNYLSDICKRVNRHANTSLNKTLAELKNMYFGTPWEGVSVVVGCCFIAFAITQTLLSLLTYFKYHAKQCN